MQRQAGIDSHTMPWLHIDVYSAQTGTEKEKKCECRRFTVFGDRWNSI